MRPKLLAAAKANPAALICGEPRFDASVPKSRLYGRKLTAFWVAVETLSLRMPDTMCGYRVYPLGATIALLDAARLGSRMDFDIEVVVKLYWRNVRVIGVQPEDSPAMARSVERGERVRLDHVGIFADGVAVRQVGELTLPFCRRYVDDIILVNEDELCAAIQVGVMSSGVSVT